MQHFYTPGAAHSWKRRASFLLCFSLGLVAAALAVCIIFCTRVTQANAQTLLLASIALFTLAGWTCILLLSFAYAPARANTVHFACMLAEQPETLQGMITLHRESFRIPKSVTVRKVTLETDEGSLSLSVNASLAHLLPANGSAVRVNTVRKFITGCEVIG